MARFRKSPAASKLRVGQEKHPRQQLKKSDRSSYFARREAAKVLRTVLVGDSQRRAVGTIKSLVYSPSVRNKKATLALVCQTLKHLPVIKEVLENANAISGNWKLQEELIYVVAYDILFGQETSLVGDAEEFLSLQKENLDSAFQNLLVRKKAKTVLDLLPDQTHDVEKPVYVRVNTLKLDMESAMKELGKLQKVSLKAPKRLPLERPGMPDCEHFLKTQGCKFGRNCKYNHPRVSSVSGLPQRPSEPTCVFYLENGICNYGTICKFHHPVGKVEKDDVVPDLLILPSGTDLHDHPLIKEGNIFLQGKASSMVAVALAPKPGWKVLDACAAPGNKTAHLAASMGRKGRIIACEKDKKRVTRLRETIRLSGASTENLVRTDPIKDKEGFFIAVFVRKPVMESVKNQRTDPPKVAAIDDPDAPSEKEESPRRRSKLVAKVSYPFQFSTKLSRMLLL